MALFTELRRRNVIKVALLYAVAAWLIVWVVARIAANVDLPPWTETFLLLVIAIGFPVALIFAWTYEITPAGLKKAVDVDQTQSIVYKTGQKLNAAVAVLAVLGLLSLVGERLLPTFEFLVPGPPEGDAPALATTPPDIRSLTLDNGLEVIVWPDHDIPNVAMYMFVRAGGRNEYPGITGLSHFFEHMMFQAGKAFPAGEFDRLMEAAGGRNNAYTSNDLTVYQDWFPRTALKTIFELEADRFENLQIEPDTVESERGVVYSERRSGVDNNNVGRLFEQVQATAFIAHPYQNPVIGWPSDVEAWTQEDLEWFYRTYYAPNNCTLVIVGDITVAEAFDYVDDYFGPIPAQEPPAAVRTVEPEQEGVRRLTIETDAQTPLLHLAFKAGSATDPVTARMTLLLNILVGGESSRLHRLLVEDEGLALSVDAFQFEGFDPGLVYFYLTLPPGADPAAVEARLLEALTQVIDEGVTEAELSKARNIVLADYWRELATISGKANTLGNVAVFHGDYEKLFTRPEEVEAITAADLQSAAATVFRTSGLTVGVLQQASAAEAAP